MLNLKELERKLDNALSNETEKSLSQWLLSKRSVKGLEFLGEGTFEELVQSHTSINAYGCKPNNEFEYSEEYSAGEYEYAMAA